MTKMKFTAEDVMVSQESGRDTGGWIWQAAYCLERTLRAQYSGWEDRTILELGSGTGWLALRLAALGASVVATDRASRLQLLRRNVLLTQAKFAGAEQDLNVRVCELEWGNPTEQPLGDFDLIIGSDLLYHAEVHDKLLAELESRLKPATTAVIAFEERNPGAEGKFLDSAKALGLEVALVDTQLIEQSLEDDFFAENTKSSHHKILVFSLRRGEPPKAKTNTSAGSQQGTS